MITLMAEPKKRDEFNICSVCNLKKFCHYHHTYGRRYSDEGIWACPTCHAKIHASPEWSYLNGYMKKHNNFYSKPMIKKKNKQCTHSKSYYDSSLGYLKCNFCGKEVQTLNFGTKKARKSSKATKTTIKMGSEIALEHIKKASILRSRFEVLTKLTKTKDLTKLERYQKEFLEVTAEMHSLQAEFDLE